MDTAQGTGPAHGASFPEQNPNPILQADLSGALTYANPAARERFPELSTGTREHPMVAGLAEAAEPLAEGSQASIVREVEVGGRIFEEHVSLDDDGDHLAVFAVEVTERAAAEAALRQHAEALARSNEELERFAFIASHDLREPVRSVVSFAQLMEREHAEQLGEEALELLGFIVDAARRVDKNLKGLQDYVHAEREGQAFEDVDLETLYGTVLEGLEPMIAEAGATVTCDALPVVHGDRDQLGVVLRNLLSNAIKFHAPGQDPLVHVGAERAEAGWHLSVQDTGIGIPEAHRDRIFTIFTRLNTPDKYPGTGVGLAICKRIVQRHGGRIWVESEEGRGSVFHVFLPDEDLTTGGRRPQGPTGVED